MSSEELETKLMAALAGAERTWSMSDALAATRMAESLHVQGPWLAVAPDSLPSDTRLGLEDAQLEHAARNAWILSSAQSTTRVLREAQVPHCIVKGVALLPWLAHPGDRWLDDVDFLVPVKHRLRAVEALFDAGFKVHRHLRHDGSLSDPRQHGTSSEWEDLSGVSIDVHFIRRALPDSEPRDGLQLAAPAALATGLSNHVVLHHALAHRFCARHITDIRALLHAGHRERLIEASNHDEALHRTLAYMRFLGAPDLSTIAPRDLPVGGDIRDHLRSSFRRVRSLASSGELVRSLVPSGAYLRATLEDTSASTLALHWQRWKRIAGRARAGG